METLASTPANADNTATATTGEADANLDAATGDGSAPSVPEADTSAPKVKEDPVQKRIDQLTREKYDALRDRDRGGYEIERLRAEVEQLRTAKQPEVAPQNDFPTLEQFGFDEGRYAAAVAQHYSKLATEQGTKAAQEALRAERERQEAESAHKSWASKEAEFMKSKPDYLDKVIEGGKRGDWKCTPEMAHVIQQSELGAAMAYHLAENPAIAAAIVQLPPLVQARELGRIEAKLELAKVPSKPAVSQAPPPVQKVDNSDAPVDSDPSVMSDKQFAKWREKQIAARRNQ